MKKIFLAALMALGFTSQVWAASNPIATYMKFDELKFRAQVAANAPSVWDSTVTSRVGAAGASSVLDTTVAIGTDGWAYPNTFGNTDSTSFFCTLLVHDATTAGDCESGADSLAAAIQVSADGTTWVTLGAVSGQSAGTTNPITSRNNQTIANGAFHDRLSLNGAALAAGQPLWMFVFRVRMPASLAISDPNAIINFPYVRFVLSFHDPKGYIVQAKVAHWSASNN